MNAAPSELLICSIIAAGGLAGQGPVDGGAGIHCNGMPQVQVRKFHRQARTVGQAVCLVLLRIAGDINCVTDTGLY